MDDEERKALITSYLKAFDNGGTGADGRQLLDYFAEDALFYFPKWGVATGKKQIGELFGDLATGVRSVTHHFWSFNWFFSAPDVVVVEGTTQGEHREGPWHAGLPAWGAGRWCGVFEVRDQLIQRAFIYLDPDYAGRDTERYPWIRPVAAGPTAQA
jgi:ketosteroid isomerase-like protein